MGQTLGPSTSGEHREWLAIPTRKYHRFDESAIKPGHREIGHIPRGFVRSLSWVQDRLIAAPLKHSVASKPSKSWSFTSRCWTMLAKLSSEFLGSKLLSYLKVNCNAIQKGAPCYWHVAKPAIPKETSRKISNQHFNLQYTPPPTSTIEPWKSLRANIEMKIIVNVRISGVQNYTTYPTLTSIDWVLFQFRCAEFLGFCAVVSS